MKEEAKYLKGIVIFLTCNRILGQLWQGVEVVYLFFFFFLYNLSANKPCISVPPTQYATAASRTPTCVSVKDTDQSVPSMFTALFTVSLLKYYGNPVILERQAGILIVRFGYRQHFLWNLTIICTSRLTFPKINNWHAVALGQTQFMTFKEEIVSYSFGMLKLYTKISKKI